VQFSVEDWVRGSVQIPSRRVVGRFALGRHSAAWLVAEDEHLAVEREGGGVPDSDSRDDDRPDERRILQGAAVGGIEAPLGESVPAGAARQQGVAEDHSGVVAAASRGLEAEEARARGIVQRHLDNVDPRARSARWAVVYEQPVVREVRHAPRRVQAAGEINRGD